MNTFLTIFWIAILSLVAIRFAIRLFNYLFDAKLFRAFPSLQKPPDKLEISFGFLAIIYVLIRSIFLTV